MVSGHLLLDGKKPWGLNFQFQLRALRALIDGGRGLHLVPLQPIEPLHLVATANRHPFRDEP